MGFTASLEGFAITDILQILSVGRLSGVATIAQPNLRIRVVFREGNVLFAKSSNQSRLGEVLLSENIITEHDLENILREQRDRRNHEPLGSILVQSGLVLPEVLERETRDQIRRVFRELVELEFGEFTFKPARITERLTILKHGLPTQELLLEALIARDSTEEYAEPDDEVRDEMMQHIP